jgi:hypothetical protein
MSGNGFSKTLLEKHLAELEERKAHREAKVRRRPKYRQRKYWQTWKRGGFTRRRKELNELLKMIKESQTFWE